jgi:hypothetical protein
VVTRDGRNLPDLVPDKAFSRAITATLTSSATKLG